MLTVEQHRERVLALAVPLPAEECALGEGFGRVLDEDLAARFPVPPFDNSAMDGFAVRSVDATEGQTQLRVVGDIPAGASSAPTVGPGEAARIMTGAPLPPGADAVVPVEHTDQPLGDTPLPEFVVVGATSAGKNVRHGGEDVVVGDVVLRAGQRWTPAAAGAAASIGHATVRLRRRVKVAVLATGTELVAAGESLGFGQIPDSNSLLISGLVEQFGGEVVLARAVSDDVDDFRAALAEAADADVIVTSGGVSVGAFEVVRQVVEGDVEFVKVAMQPGKPQGCGRLRRADAGEQALLALPGNPVSVFVSAWVYLRPLLAAFQGVAAPWRGLRLPAADGWKTPPGRRQYIPVVLTDDGVRRSHRLGSGSHLVASLHLAEALAVVPEDVEAVAPGDLLDVFLI
ncbi:molybdopterin molybdotransferase MoeA [Tessaracoccus caeni]|uniref:molybdopterin molybdotransferase MoeA n=1 Tax=Tessaracoccus caeni TaxID=3031239 RepID=UPI0023DCB349|nr:gephyrin-like molybdotransferase Glp [Tessaracoccus caeni]MDF1487611.1 molybdopterin molybdotransferase MoeA [Tessaracoccus caeni]